MNELGDLFTPHEEISCAHCDRPHYLRSGYKDHMKNAHNMDSNGNLLPTKKSAKRQNLNKKAKVEAAPPPPPPPPEGNLNKKAKVEAAPPPPPPPPEGNLNKKAKVEAAPPPPPPPPEGNLNKKAKVEAAPPPPPEGEGVNKNRVVVGDEDLGGGYVYADEHIWTRNDNYFN